MSQVASTRSDPTYTKVCLLYPGFSLLARTRSKDADWDDAPRRILLNIKGVLEMRAWQRQDDRMIEHTLTVMD